MTIVFNDLPLLISKTLSASKHNSEKDMCESEHTSLHMCANLLAWNTPFLGIG